MSPTDHDAQISVKYSESLPEGTIIEGRYRIDSFLGCGGMSSVYKATHLNLQRQVALKLLRRAPRNPEAALRFQREAQTMSSLKHPNIVDVLGMGIYESRPFITMELLDGISLAELLKRDGQMSEAKAIAIFEQLCDALAHAHAAGIVHRDIKPSNVMLINDEKTVKLVDFGIAKFSFESQQDLQKLTETGALLGSASYMSPEQCRAGELDERSDVYSLGCLMYEVMTGENPFQADSQFESMAKHLSPTDRPTLGPAIASIGLVSTINQSLSIDPESRPQSAEQVKKQLTMTAGHIINEQAQTQRNISQPRRFRKPFALVTVAVLIAGITAAISIAPSMIHGERHVENADFDALFQQGKNMRMRVNYDLPVEQNRKIAEEAITMLEKSLGIAEQLQDSDKIGKAEVELSFAYMNSGTAARREKQIVLLKDAIDNRGLIQNLPDGPYALGLRLLADSLLNARNAHDALAYYSRLYDLGTKMNNTKIKAWGAEGMGKTYKRLEKHDKALHFLEESVTLAQSQTQQDCIVSAELELARELQSMPVEDSQYESVRQRAIKLAQDIVDRSEAPSCRVPLASYRGAAIDLLKNLDTSIPND